MTTQPATTPPPQRRPLYYNVISHVGTLIAIIAALLMLVALVASFTMDRLNQYVGIFTYMVFPAIFVIGILLVLLGMRWEAGRRRRTESLDDLPYPNIDLNDKGQRRLFGVSVVGGVLVLTLIAWASYQGFHYTESTAFCGQTCHVPMEPEFTAYQESAHARVLCVECHVGEGAGWYVKSKLSGARQLIAVVTGSYSRPIPTPIAHLRPARETCETCHWPEKFFGAKLLQLPHFRFDEPNTAEQITLTLKTGGGSRAHGESQGIHWHMVVDNTVTYAALDEKQQVIPWVKVRRRDGSEAVYVARNHELSPEKIAALPRRTMDCMDCHNRPAHTFPTPDSGIDQALLKGEIPRDLPWIKKVSVDALFREYPDRPSAHAAISESILGFYRREYPELFTARRKEIDRTVQVATNIWNRGVFPDMKVDWRTYPVNIGHRYWPGCFRCHDGEHVSGDGKVLSNDCASTCHTQPVRSNPTLLGDIDPRAHEDWHPWRMPKEHLDIKGHDMVECNECHNAGQRPHKECNDCHEK